MWKPNGNLGKTLDPLYVCDTLRICLFIIDDHCPIWSKLVYVNVCLLHLHFLFYFTLFLIAILHSRQYKPTIAITVMFLPWRSYTFRITKSKGFHSISFTHRPKSVHNSHIAHEESLNVGWLVGWLVCSDSPNTTARTTKCEVQNE